MTLKVAVVALYPAPGGKSPGGVRAVVQSLVRGFQAYHDLEIHVIHCHSDIREDATVENANATIHYLAMPRRRVVPNTLASIVRVERLLRRLWPDVASTHAAHYTLGALRAGCPTVYTIHGVVHREAQVYRSTWYDRMRFVLEAACDRYAVQNVRDIVAISPYVLTEYQGRSHARFHRIDNPIASRFFTLPNSEQDGQLLYAGTIDERKNVLGLLQALDIVRKRVPKVQLRVAGRSTSEEYDQRVRDYAASMGLDSNVEFLGLRDDDSMLQEYARCAAVVLASRQETAPMAVIEAMAAGKPIVATRVGGVADLVEDGRSGFLVDLDDARGFAQRIVQLLLDTKLRQSMGQRARQLAERFRLEKVTVKYRQLYYQVAGKTVP